MLSSITAAMSDQASSSAMRATAIFAVGLRRDTTSTAMTTIIATPAGHQTNSAVTTDSTVKQTDCAMRTPAPRSSPATW
jgi:hypothetical protein